MPVGAGDCDQQTELHDSSPSLKHSTYLVANPTSPGLPAQMIREMQPPQGKQLRKQVVASCYLC